MTGLKVIDGTSTEISKYLREKETNKIKEEIEKIINNKDIPKKDTENLLNYKQGELKGYQQATADFIKMLDEKTWNNPRRKTRGNNTMKSNKSSIEREGEIVTEIITFSNGNKKTFEDVITSSIVQGEFTHFKLKDGRLILVNTRNVDFLEVVK